MKFIPLNGRKFLPLSGTNAIPCISSRFTPLNGLKCLAKAKIQMPLQADKKKSDPNGSLFFSMLKGLLLLCLLSLSLLCYIEHDRCCDEDRSVSTDHDTEDEGYCKTSDHLTTEDCDCKHCNECSE